MTGMETKPENKGQRIVAVQTLYGVPKSGKTASLRYLYYLLLGGPTNPKAISDFKSRVGNHTEFRVCVPSYGDKGVIIKLSTIGDTEYDVELNWSWFRNKPQRVYSPLKSPTFLNLSKEPDVGDVIVIGPTHVADAGARIQTANICNIKRHLSYIDYLQKFQRLSPPAQSLSPDDEYVLNGLSGGMAGDAVRTAEQLKYNLDEMIKNF